MFTKGPWNREGNRVFVDTEYEMCSGVTLTVNKFECIVKSGRKFKGRASENECLDNAQLIANAPVMYDALQKAQEYFQSRREFDESSKEILEIISSVLSEADRKDKKIPSLTLAK